MLRKIVYTVVGWFLVGVVLGAVVSDGIFIVSQVFKDGVDYVLYPWSLFMLIIENHIGFQEMSADFTLVFGSLMIVYILIPLGVFNALNKINNQ